MVTDSVWYPKLDSSVTAIPGGLHREQPEVVHDHTSVRWKELLSNLEKHRQRAA